jgi:hypothetical protein
MNRHHLAFFGMLAGLLSFAAYAAPGEYWDITNKMEMPGMPFAMPATTQKFCIAKGSENNPEKTAGDKNCKMTDVKTVGNKTTWKANCNHDGEIMTGIGEQTATANGYEGKMQFSGKSSGHDMNMTMVFSGKRAGGSCDTEEAVKKAKAQICDSSRYHTTADWISGSDLILQPGSACGDQRQQLCDMVRKDAPKDVRAYNALQTHEQHMLGGVSIVKECRLDMPSTTKSICKTFNSENYSQLSAYCPAEAKAYREANRRRECEGRSYTAETRAADLKKCLSGKSDASEDSAASESSAPKESGKSSGSNPADEALEAAKKLRSKFGF